MQQEYGHQQLLQHLFTPSSRRILEKRPEAKSEEPDWGDKVDSGIGSTLAKG